MFIAYEVSLEVITSLRSVVSAIEAHDRDLADQLKRAASSVALNLSEGQRLTKDNRPKHYSIAHGSANEVKAALQTAIAWAGSRMRTSLWRSSIDCSPCFGGYAELGIMAPHASALSTDYASSSNTAVAIL